MMLIYKQLFLSYRDNGDSSGSLSIIRAWVTVVSEHSRANPAASAIWVVWGLRAGRSSTKSLERGGRGGDLVRGLCDSVSIEMFLPELWGLLGCFHWSSSGVHPWNIRMPIWEFPVSWPAWREEGRRSHSHWLVIGGAWPGRTSISIHYPPWPWYSATDCSEHLNCHWYSFSRSAGNSQNGQQVLKTLRSRAACIQHWRRLKSTEYIDCWGRRQDQASQTVHVCLYFVDWAIPVHFWFKRGSRCSNEPDSGGRPIPSRDQDWSAALFWWRSKAHLLILQRFRYSEGVTAVLEPHVERTYGRGSSDHP